MRMSRTLITFVLAMGMLAVPVVAEAHHVPGEDPADSVAAVDDISCTDADPGYREFVTTVDGERAYGIFAAPDTGTTPTALVVIGHGAWHSVDSWQDHIEGLTAAYDTVTVAMEYRGLERVEGHLGDDPDHPEAKNWPEKKGGEDLIAAAKLFQTACGIDTVILAGVSMGVSISGYAVSHLDPSDHGLFDYWVTSEGVHSMLETYQAASAAGSDAADWIEAETGCAYNPVTCHEPYAERTNVMQTAAIEAAGLERVIYLHATADGLVPYNQSRQMSRALQVPFEFYTLTSAGEGSDGTSWTDYVADGEGPLAGHASERDPNSLLMRASFARIGAIATGNLADCGEYHVDEGDSFPEVAFQALVTYPCGSPTTGEAPDARDDQAATNDRTAVDIDVLANDDGDDLTIVAFGQPESGQVTENADGTLRYTPEKGEVGDFSFDYTVAAPDGQTDTATVAVQVTAFGTGGQGGEGRVHGAGFWDRGTGDKHDKIDFSFDARADAAGHDGKLKLKDKDLDVSIDARSIGALSAGTGVDCDGVVLDGATSFAFTATGSFTQSDTEVEAEFFACGVDNGKNNPAPLDHFYVECTSGCDYSSGDRADDNAIDGGNIHLKDTITDAQNASDSETDESAQSSEAAVLSLDQMLLHTLPAGTPFVLTATAESATGPLVSSVLVLRWEQGNGITGEVTALTNHLGVAAFLVTVPSGDVDYTVWSGDLGSNGARLTGE